MRATTAAPPEAIRPVVSRGRDPRLPARWCGGCRWPMRSRATRCGWCGSPGPVEPGRPISSRQWVSYGASVRAAQALVLGGKARALLQGRAHVSFDDVRALARPVLPAPHAAQLPGAVGAGHHRPARRAAARRRAGARVRALSLTDRPRRLPRPRAAGPDRRSRAAGAHGRGRLHARPCTAPGGSGSSLDFAEHRAYQPGDDMRRIDWRVYGRTDRFYVKEYEADTNAGVIFALDASASMDFGSGAGHQVRLRRASWWPRWPGCRSARATASAW